jgi:uncharacterized membrane protein HdeD (DUF308 family)
MSILANVRTVIRYWWIFLLLGTLLIIFGALVFTFPAKAYADLTLFFILAFALNGLFELVFALTNHKKIAGWGWHLAGGIFDLAAAAVLFFTPVLAAVSLPLFAGFWLLFRSIAIVGRCFDLPVTWPEKAGMLTLALGGVVFSFLILYYPVLGAVGLILWTGCALLTLGLFYTFLGLHLRGWRHRK